MADTWTSTSDIEDRWRPLSEEQAERAPGIIGIIERGIRKRWPTVAARLVLPTTDQNYLDPDDLKDVVAMLARQLLEVDPDVPLRAKQWQQTSGTESESITLDGSLAGAFLTFDDWMVERLDSVTDAQTTTSSKSPLFMSPDTSDRLARALDDSDNIDWYDLQGRLE